MKSKCSIEIIPQQIEQKQSIKFDKDVFKKIN